MDPDPDWRLLEASLAARGVGLPPNALEQLQAHWHLVREANERQNLTSITGTQQAVLRHYLDSLAPLWCSGQLGLALPDERLRALDAGTGAGFPGIPLKLMRPRWQMTLADSRLKRVRFLRRVIEELGLSGCRAVHCRIEKPPPELGAFDLAFTRAMAGPPAAVRALAPLLTPKGSMVLYTGRLDEADLAALRRESEKRGLAGPTLAEVDLQNLSNHWLAALRRMPPSH